MKTIVPFSGYFALSMLALSLAGGCAPKPTPEQQQQQLRVDPTEAGIIPHQAALVASGTGKIGFVAPAEGYVYFYDASGKAVPYSFLVKTGEKVELNETFGPNQPPVTRITVDGKTVFERNERSMENAFYFLPPGSK